MEIITFILTVAGFIIAYITYRNTYLKEPQEDKDYLYHQFEFAEKSTKELISELDEYCKEHQCYHTQFMQGLTFLEGITLLRNAQISLFTEDNKTGLKALSVGKKQAENLEKRIEVHINAIQDIKTHLSFYYKKDFSADRE